MALRGFIYADESGTDRAAPVCVVGGFRGSPGQWKIFRSEWRAVLARPTYRIKYFHANEFFNRHRIPNRKSNPYLGWSEAKAAALLGELLMVIRRRKIYPIGCAVNVKDFHALGHDERCVLAGYLAEKHVRRQNRKPAAYHLAFRVAIEDAAQDVRPDTELHYVFAEQEQYKQRAMECWQLTKEYNKPLAPRLKSIAFQSPEHEPALQAADLYVRAWYNTFVRGQHRLNRENALTMDMLTHKRADMLYADASGMERAFQDAGITDAWRLESRERESLMDEIRNVLENFKGQL